MNTHYEYSILNDCNTDLINLFQTVKSDGNSFIDYARQYFTPDHNSATQYYQLRERFNHSSDTVDKAALFLYLNRHCYNGLCRFNLSGKFNVPFGRINKPYFPQHELHHFYQKAQHADIQCCDFTQVMQYAGSDDVCYCDPPYIALTDTAYFTSYSASPFTLREQQLLADTAKQAAGRGATVIISNHDTPVTRKLYRGATLSSFEVRRFISCNVDQRNPVKEILATFKANKKFSTRRRKSIAAPN